MFYETSDNGHGLPHDPFKACIVPRPIGWITTLSRSGVVNLAPFSFFNALTENPPYLMYCPNGPHSEGGSKDSLVNVRETGEFVANLATWDLREQVNTTSAPVGRAVDEMRISGLTALPSTLVRPPRVKESPIHLECVLHQVLELPSRSAEQPNNVVIGRVVGIHIDDDVLTDGLVDITKVQPIARLGYMEYAVVREVFRMARPTFSAVEAAPALSS